MCSRSCPLVPQTQFNYDERTSSLSLSGGLSLCRLMHVHAGMGGEGWVVEDQRTVILFLPFKEKIQHTRKHVMDLSPLLTVSVPNMKK